MNNLFDNEAWRHLAQEGDRLLKAAAGTVRAGVDSLSHRAEILRRQVRLSRAICDLEEEIDRNMQDVGELIYATHRGNPSDSDEVQEILQYVDGLYEELQAHRRQLRRLAGAVFCESCGAENLASYSYCHNCGHPLHETVEVPRQD